MENMIMFVCQNYNIILNKRVTGGKDKKTILQANYTTPYTRKII